MKFTPQNREFAPRERITGRQRVLIEQAFFGTHKFDADAQCWQLELTVKGGKFHGRKLWVNYLHSSPNASVGKLGWDQSMLGDLVRAVGLESIESDDHTGEVHMLRGKEVECEIGPKGAGTNDEPKKWYRDRQVDMTVDTSRRGGQLAAVIRAPIDAGDNFSDEIPF
jgi:hypothetical protein